MFTVTMKTVYGNPNPTEISLSQAMLIRKNAEGLTGDERDNQLIQEAFLLGQSFQAPQAEEKEEATSATEVDFSQIWDEFNDILKGFTIPGK